MKRGFKQSDGWYMLTGRILVSQLANHQTPVCNMCCVSDFIQQDILLYQVHSLQKVLFRKNSLPFLRRLLLNFLLLLL